MARRGTRRNVVAAAGGVLAAALLAAGPAAPARERGLAADVEAFVEVEIAGVGITPGGAPAVLLHRAEAKEVVPIFIGTAQARAIVLALREVEPPRPMTHDLFSRTLDALEARLVRVYVDDIRDSTYYGMLELDVAGREEPLRVDSRPSDALALALRAGASIHMAPKVLESARRLEHGGLSEEIVKAAGITVNAATADLRRALELPDRPGVVVSSVTGPARRAGLEPGALITGVNGQAPENPLDFLELLRETPPGEKAAITYWQGGESHRIEVPTDIPEPREVRREA